MKTKDYEGRPGYYSSFEEQSRIKIVLDMIGTNKKVVDLGCYNGFILKKIASKNNDVIGLESSKKLVDNINLEGFMALRGDVEKKFHFKDKSFDVVFAGEIIEHLVNTDLFLEEINRVLKDNGLLIITTPNVASLDRRIMLLLNMNAFFEASFTFPKNAAGHLRFFNNSLLSLIFEI